MLRVLSTHHKNNFSLLPCPVECLPSEMHLFFYFIVLYCFLFHWGVFLFHRAFLSRGMLSCPVECTCFFYSTGIIPLGLFHRDELFTCLLFPCLFPLSSRTHVRDLSNLNPSVTDFSSPPLTLYKIHPKNTMSSRTHVRDLSNLNPSATDFSSPPLTLYKIHPKNTMSSRTHVRDLSNLNPSVTDY